jgi:membrane-bound lytic murein transglycosylase A
MAIRSSGRDSSGTVNFSVLTGEDDHLPAFEAFRRSAFHVLTKPYRSGSLGVAFDSFAAAYADSRETLPEDSAGACAFFERHFVPAHVSPEETEHGFVTGFYEPVAKASPVRTEKFTVPLLSRPDDLIVIDDTNRPAGMDPYLAFGRKADPGLVEYFDRPAIEQGALVGRGLEIAWLENKVDAFGADWRSPGWKTRSMPSSSMCRARRVSQ